MFSYGYDERYIVAKQHPGGDRNITNYFYLDMSKDYEYASPSASVTGPMNQDEFANESKRLNLPKFSRVLRSLK